MCFNKELTLVFSLISVVFGTGVILGKGPFASMEQWRRARISYCFFFFAFMEFLQFFDYIYINKCDEITNIAWTQLGYYHICFQPLFSNLAFSALDPKNLKKQREETWRFIFKFCAVTATLMSLRMIIPSLTDLQNEFFLPCTEHIEGFCGPMTCSQTGNYHLRWTFKLLRPSYLFPSISLHCLNMFITPILMGQCLGSVVLFMTGPFIAAFFNATSGEKASIWCFFSIMETTITCLAQYMAVRHAMKNQKSK